MSKKTVWFIALLLTTLPSFAQFRAGVKGGGNISSMNMTMGNVELDIHDPRFGVHGGLMGEYMFSGVFGLQAELSYYYCGANINAARYTQGMDVPEGLSLEGYVSRHVFHLPLYLKTKFKLSENTRLYDGWRSSLFLSCCPPTYHRRTREYLKTKWFVRTENPYPDEESSNAYMIQQWNVSRRSRGRGQ